MAYGAVLDACVLIPVALCDVLLRAAQRDLYRIHWSELILAEVERNLGKLGIDPAKAQKRVDAMRAALARANVEGFEGIIDSMPNHPKDRHVLAAAVIAGAQSIVTFNLKDFHTDGTAQSHIRAEHPDAFLTNLFHLYPDALTEIITHQAAALGKGGRVWAPEDVLDRLARQGCACFADLVRAHLQQEQEIPELQPPGE